MKFLLVFISAAATVAASHLKLLVEYPILGVDTVFGCYSSIGELQQNGTSTFNSQGSCTTACEAIGAYVAASQVNSCYCGDKYPPASTRVDSSQCDEPCPGFAREACGGSEAFTVYNTGLKLTVENSTDDSSSSKV
jgi:cell wall integrity and stress response component